MRRLASGNLSGAGAALLAAALLASGALVTLHYRWVAQGIAAYNTLDRAHLQREAGGPDVYPASRSLFFDVDPFLWNHYALQVARGDVVRVRSTAIDNHPYGREVHWTNGLIWVLAGAGHVRRFITGEDLQTALERASLSVNPLFLGALLAASAAVLCRRLGLPAAAFGVLAIGGSASFLTAFSPGGPDHHGLAMAAAFLAQLGIILGGAGWTSTHGRPQESLPTPAGARRWFLLSALSAAVGLWVNAFSQLFSFATMGLGFATMLAAGRPAGAAAGIAYRPELWRFWGRIGALAALGFYLLEYFPRSMSLRLETNHPLFVLSWWGAAELMAVLAGRRFCGGAARRIGTAGIILAIVALLSPILALSWWGSEAYAPLDPFVWRLHTRILEFQPSSLKPFLMVCGFPLLSAALVALRCLACRARPEFLAVTAFAFGTALASVAMVFWQSRWVFLASQSLVVFLVAGLFLPAGSAAAACRRGPLAAFCALLLAAQFFMTAFTTLKFDFDLKRLAYPNVTLSRFLTVRDVADVLRADADSNDTVVLSWGWPSTILAYEAGHRVISSLYWENAAGLKAAADIFLSRTDGEALRLIRERGVTHIVVLRSSFSPSEIYYFRHGREERGEIEQSLGARIIQGRAPTWLRPVAYVPALAELRNSYLYDVLIFRVLAAPGER